MVARSIVKLVKASPLKLMHMAKNIRGKSLNEALNWLHSSPSSRGLVFFKVISSAWANAKNKDQSVEKEDLKISSVVVNRGPAVKYSKPGAMGRPVIKRRRFSNIEICLDRVV